MPNNPLAPHDAARLADAVYLGLEVDDVDEFRRRSSSSLMRTYNPSSNLIMGRTGPTRRSNFAVVLDKIGTNEKVVAIRGTDFPSPNDWLTNFNCGIQPGPNNQPAHAGFLFAYRSIIRAIRAGVGTGSSKPDIVHVVGHSLGGSIANHVAVDLKMRGHNPVLYTFGAPRVGHQGYASDVSTKLRGNIYRVYDFADPVPMLPMWPFVHAPSSGESIRIGSNSALVSVGQHSMETNYVPAMEQSNNWNLLRNTSSSTMRRRGYPTGWSVPAKPAGSPAARWGFGRSAGRWRKS